MAKAEQQGLLAGGRDQADLQDRVRSLRLPKHASPERSWKMLLAWLVFFCLLGAAAVVGYRELVLAKDPEAKESPVASQGSPAPGAASVQAAAGTDASGLALEAKGYIIPAQQVLVSPKVSGMIEKLYVVEGQRVQKGAVLAELEKTEYQSDVQRFQAMLDAAKERYTELERGFRDEEIRQAEAELGEAKVQLTQSETEWERTSQLRSKQAISQEEYDAALSQRDALEQRVRRLELRLSLLKLGPRQERVRAAAAEMRQTEAELAKAQWRLDNCTIRAPISGTILKKNAEEGNIVNSVAFNGSFSVCDMADLSDMEVELTIQERDISRVSPGQKCRVRADAFPDRVYAGHVSRIMPIADRAKGAIPVRVKVEIPRGRGRLSQAGDGGRGFLLEGAGRRCG